MINLRRHTASTTLLAASLMLASCAPDGQIGSNGNNQYIGAGGGALLGGLIGGMAASHDRVAGALIGAAVGGAAGYAFGTLLNEHDQQLLAQQQSQALLTQPDGSTSNWTSAQSGATATIVTSNTRTETQSVKIVRDTAVAPAPQLDMINAAYVTNTTANVRLGPSSSQTVAKVLPPGTQIWAVGKVSGAPWIMVAQNGESIGYVFAGSAGPAGSNATAAVASDNTVAAAGPVRQPADLDALGPNETADTVTTAVPCRDVSTTVDANGKTATSSQTACRSPDGSWDID